jgi:hypothetical protein
MATILSEGPEKEGKGCDNVRGSKSAASLQKFALAAGLVTGVAVFLISPTWSTAAFLATALLVLLVAVGVLRGGSRLKLLSVKVKPEIALLLVTITLCILGSEAFLRLFWSQQFPDFQHLAYLKHNLGFRYDATLGWFPVAHSHGKFNSMLSEISMDNNSQGFRDIEPVLSDKPRIMFVGDSFVWGYDVQAAERFTDKLRARHPEWNIYNCGVSGYGTDQEHLLLKQRFDDYKPRLVFLVFCTENDDENNCSNNSEGTYFKPYFTVGRKGLVLHGTPVPPSERVFCLRHPLLFKSYLARLVLRAYENLQAPNPHPAQMPTFPLIGAMRDFSKSKGATFAVALTARYPALEQFLQENHIPFLDLSGCERFRPHDHWNAQGQAQVCDRVEDFLIAGKLMGL